MAEIDAFRLAERWLSLTRLARRKREEAKKLQAEANALKAEHPFIGNMIGILRKAEKVPSSSSDEDDASDPQPPPPSDKVPKSKIPRRRSSSSSSVHARLAKKMKADENAPRDPNEVSKSSGRTTSK